MALHDFFTEEKYKEHVGFIIKGSRTVQVSLFKNKKGIIKYIEVRKQGKMEYPALIPGDMVFFSYDGEEGFTLVDSPSREEALMFSLKT